MGDGLPSFAPQWLKSGSSSALGAGTHGNSLSSREEGARLSSWRESGSRLGLGAGTDRESASSEGSKPTQLGGRRLSGYQERNNRDFTGERNSSYRQGISGRVPSDRELVEQTSSLKLRPVGRTTGDAGFHDPGSHLGGHHNNGERAHGSRSGQSQRSSSRKLGSTQRNAPLHPRTPERDLGSLGRHPVAGNSLQHSRLVGGPPLSPRLVLEQPWTSRLADAPMEAQPSQTPPDSHTAAPSPSAVAPSKPKPAQRMADAILQAQANAAQEAEAAKLAKVRMEQIALRQSKQLVPVIAGSKPKHHNNALSPSGNSNTTALKKVSGLEPLGRPGLSTLSLSARKDDDAVANGKRTSPPGTGPAAIWEGAVNSASPRVPSKARPARDRDRLAFFGSLRRKTSGGELTGNGDQLVRQGSSNASDAASVTELVSPKQTESPAVIPNGPAEAALRFGAQATPEAQEADKGVIQPQNGTMAASELSGMTPEEAAFMRSLGWEETDDDAEGGLTEEEVAAFRAKYPNDACKFSPLTIAAQQSQHSTPAGKGAAQPHSFHSELEFSDSDTD